MTIFNPSSTTTSANSALVVAIQDSSVLVRDGIYLLASGTDHNAIEATAEDINMVIAGYLASDDSNGIEVTNYSEIALRPAGSLQAYFDGIYSDGFQNRVVNEGLINANIDGIDMKGTGNDIINSGTINAGDEGIITGNGGHVQNSGSVFGINAVTLTTSNLQSSSFVANSGLMMGGNGGIRVLGSDARITNSGTVQGGSTGVFGNGDALRATITNSGEITGGSNGVSFSTDNVTLNNSGIVTGSSRAATLTGATATVVNTGEMTGRALGLSVGPDANISNSGLISGNGGIAGVSDNGEQTGVGTTTITNTGSILANQDEAIALTGSGNSVANGITGVIESNGGGAVELAGSNNSVTNVGTIRGSDAGVAMIAGRVYNSGTITSGTNAVLVFEKGDVSNTGHMASINDVISVGGIATLVNSGSLASELGAGVFMGADTSIMTNSGEISSELVAIHAAGDGVGITNSGTILGGTDGFRAGYGALIQNSGALMAGETAILLSGSGGGDDAAILNTGEVQGIDIGIAANLTDASVTVQNAGSIQGGLGVVLGNTATGTVSELVNTGTITGIDIAIQGASGAQRVFSTGLISGNVELGGGNDLFDGLGGVVNGVILGGTGNDTLTGGMDDDRIDGGQNFDLISGYGGNDTLLGDSGLDTIYGGDGDDSIDAGTSSDFVGAGAGNDYVLGQGGNDTIYGFDGNDTLQGNDGTDIVYGGNGDDDLNGGNGLDLIYGGAGNDTIGGGTDADTLNGGDGEDLILGWLGDDLIFGNAGHDMLDGQGGNDTLAGGWGNDTLSGGADADVFRMIRANGDDVITDFENNTDLIDVSALQTTYGALATGLSDYNGGALIDLTAVGGTGSIWVQGVPSSFLNANDFIF